VGNVITVAKFF